MFIWFQSLFYYILTAQFFSPYLFFLLLWHVHWWSSEVRHDNEELLKANFLNWAFTSFLEVSVETKFMSIDGSQWKNNMFKIDNDLWCYNQLFWQNLAELAGLKLTIQANTNISVPWPLFMPWNTFKRETSLCWFVGCWWCR